MAEKNTTVSGGIGLAGALTVLFVALKLLDKIDWSWWWVISPIWIEAGIFFAIIVIAFIIAGLIAIFKK